MFKKLLRFNLLVLAAAAIALTAPAAFGVTDSTTLSQVINAGSLTTDITNGTVSLAAVTYSHSGQNNQNNALGDITVNDDRGSAAGWTANWTGADWTDGTHPMDYNGDGSTTGQLCANNPVAADVTVNAGTDDKASWTYGADDCFDAGTSTVNFITTGATKGNGDYTIANTKVDQFIPGQQAAGTYTMTMTLTVS